MSQHASAARATGAFTAFRTNLGVILGAIGLAAGAAASGADQGSVAGGSDQLAEIVVTANKLNTQKVLDVPGAIQAISGDSLQKAGVAEFMDIAGAIPGLSVQDLGPGDKKYVIRGINSSGDSTAGIYYGEAVISGSNADDGGGFQSDIRLYDLDRVEVLRGPQGTLYGASSMSGTIRFIVKSPDLNAAGGYVSAEGSNTSHASSNYNLNGALNLPLSDGVLGMRLVGWTSSDSGFIDQYRVGTLAALKGVNNDDVGGGRIIVRYQPNDNLTIEANYTAQSESSNGSSRYTPAGVTSWGTPPGPGSPIPTVQGCDLCNTDVTRSPWTDNLKVFGLTASYKMPSGTVTATTNQYNRATGFTFDSTPILVSFNVPVAAATLEPRTRDVTSSEVRYASNFATPVNFVIGAYREYDSQLLTVQVITTNAFGVPTAPFSSANSQDALTYPGVGATFFGRTDSRKTTQYAGFSEVTWKVTDDWTVIGGLRYFTESLEGVQVQTHPFGGFPPGPTLVPLPDPNKSFNKVTYKGNVSYKAGEAALLYTTISTGFRSGGLNAISEPFEPIPTAFVPDTLTNYEVGAKGRLFGGALDYQADVYLIHWNNIQVQETTADGAFSYLGNAGTAEVKGVEIELQAHPTAHFTASLAGSYQDAILTDGATAAQKTLNPTLGVTGERIPNVPKLQFNLGLKQTMPLSSGWDAFVAADVSYRGSVDAYFASNAYNIPLDSYTLVNLRAGVSSHAWSVTAFARNLTDERTQVSAINSSQDPHGLLTVRPRTIGVIVTRTF